MRDQVTQVQVLLKNPVIRGDLNLPAAGNAVGTLTTAASNVAEDTTLDPQAYFVDSLFRAGPGATPVAGTSQDFRGEATRILANGAIAGTVPDADKAYLSLSGRAETLTDRVLAARVWKNTDDVWWSDGPSDRYVRVLKFAPHLAELWDGPAGAAVARHELARARETGEAPDLGENRKVAM